MNALKVQEELKILNLKFTESLSSLPKTTTGDYQRLANIYDNFQSNLHSLRFLVINASLFILQLTR